jgi:hypothetical protein
MKPLNPERRAYASLTSRAALVVGMAAWLLGLASAVFTPHITTQTAPLAVVSPRVFVQVLAMLSLWGLSLVGVVLTVVSSRLGANRRSVVAAAVLNGIPVVTLLIVVVARVAH